MFGDRELVHGAEQEAGSGGRESERGREDLSMARECGMGSRQGCGGRAGPWPQGRQEGQAVVTLSVVLFLFVSKPGDVSVGSCVYLFQRRGERMAWFSFQMPTMCGTGQLPKQGAGAACGSPPGRRGAGLEPSPAASPGCEQLHRARSGECPAEPALCLLLWLCCPHHYVA